MRGFLYGDSMNHNIWYFRSAVQEKFRFRYPLTEFQQMEHSYIPEMLRDTLPKKQTSVLRRIFSLKTVGLLFFAGLTVCFVVSAVKADALGERIVAVLFALIAAAVSWVLFDAIRFVPIHADTPAVCGEIVDYCGLTEQIGKTSQRVIVYLIEIPSQQKCLLYGQFFTRYRRFPWTSAEQYDRQNALPIGTAVLVYRHNNSEEIVSLSESERDMMLTAPPISERHDDLLVPESLLYRKIGHGSSARKKKE